MSFVKKGTALANPAQATSGSVSIGTVTAHNLLVCTVHHGSTSNPPGINTPSGWSVGQLGPAVTVAGYTVQSAIFYIMDAPAGTNTANLSTSNQSSFYAVISEYSGYATTSVLNQLGIASSTGTNSLTGTGSSGTPQANELYIVATAIDDSAGTTNNGSAAPSGYTSLLSFTNTQTDDSGQHAYQEVTSSATISATQTSTATSFMSMALASFKAAGGGGSTTTVSPGKGSVVLGGKQPTVTQTVTTTVSPGAGHIVLAGHAPSIGETIAPGKGHVTVTGYQPAVSQSVTTTVAPGAGHLTLSGYAPTITVQTNVQPGVGHLTLAGHAPGIVETFLPGAGHITLTGYLPTVNQTTTRTVSPTTGHIFLAGHVPTFGTASAVDWLQRARHRHRR